MHRRCASALALLAVITVGTVTAVGLAGAATVEEPTQATTEWKNVTITQEYRLQPDDPGQIEVTATVSFPDIVTEFEVAVPWQGTVTDTDGFESTVSRRYEWTGESKEATITYDLDANETVRGDGPERGSGRFLYADTGSWALVRPPDLEFVTGRFETTDGDVDVGIDHRRTVAGDGAVGDLVAYLGPHETYTRTAHGQTFELVVPEAASMAAEPEAVLAAFANASDEFRVGDRDERVFTVAAPTSVEWAVLGLQTWDSDMWVRADEPIETADNTWLHEYVHSRQQLNTTNATEWLIEATATYHAAALALEDDLADFDSFEGVLDRGTRDRYDEVVLAEQSTWTGNAEYDKGGLVAGELDRLIRLATTRSSHFETVLGDLNDDTVIDHDRFLQTVERIANESVAATADRYLTSEATPTTWTRTQHEAAFGATPAEFTTELASGSDAYRIAGPYRNVSSGDIGRLAVNETVTVPLTVTNVGGSAGAFDIPLTVDGTVVSRATGRLDANESTTIELSHTFEQPGTYSVGTGDDVTTVEVTEPVAAVVESVAADPSSLDTPGNVTLEATVANNRDFPAAATLSFTRNGTMVAERTVSMGPGETRTVEATVSLSDAGRYELGVNNRTTTVVVDPARFEYAIDETTAITVDGEYRTLSATEIPPLVVGETVTIPVTVVNHGGLAGQYTAKLSIDGDVVTHSSGRLAAGESRSLTLSYQFKRPGTYRLGVGDHQQFVQVRDPATPTVRSTDLDPDSLSEPGDVTVTATVDNEAPIPASGEVRFTRDGTTVAAETVTLGANETGTVSRTVRLSSPGTYRIRAGSVATSVTVEATGDSASEDERADDGSTVTASPGGATSTDSAEPTTASGPGFSAVVAMLAIALTAIGCRRC
ncbi:beta-glucosidase protein [Halorhabdus tiamatea SARL4B]|uniref:Beta-glucosidase protein n=1 Tax=Halorhabdus tiamatea SARL4B TaxID=1033806 RepID=F7PG37_9EURY|nr:CARDB domain-containing protein [Halorhabdus tiamatea]ERJ06299.1 beta-glucosidase protein [Halorhabdus tiamatea SARL4B]CCQ34647.1 glycyl aminopeptidase-like protein [Halorhabdus tiamatea SARL4B]